MMKIVALSVVGMMLSAALARAQEARNAGAPKILVAYFSKTNNTKTVAEYIHANVGGDIFQVTPKKPYPADYRETTRTARVELDGNARPELADTIAPETMKDYDVVFIGYPNWWGTLPMAMFTFLEQFDLTGKTVVPFCTHEGSGLGRGPADLETLCPGAVVAQGLAVRGGSVGSAEKDVAEWLRKNGYGK